MSGSWGIGCLASDVTKARLELEKMKRENGFLEPERGSLDDPNIKWKYGKPDYTMVNLEYMKGKTKNHLAGSLELMVENFVKRWETESAHFKELDQWSTINKENYHVQANGGKVSSGPPIVAFTWRHWAHFTGQYMGRRGSGQLIEMYGSAVVELDKNNKIVSIQIDYKPEEFLKALLGDTNDLPSQLSTEKESACPMCPKFKSVL
ncbi:uncharacterized protein LOC144880340 [Branchiostoma floridae x Branchiostoma japonicum]